MRLINRLASSVVLCAAAAAVVISAPAAHAQTYSNTAAISIPASATDGRGTLYPSTITVSGAPVSIQYVSVTLTGVSHPFFSDLRVLLVGPAGQQVMLLADTNGSGDAIDSTLTFVPSGPAVLPGAISNVISGVYDCSVYNNASLVNLPAPAPAGPYGQSLAPLNGTNANGTWSLYVWDRFPGSDNGLFARGWSIAFNRTPSLPMPSAFSYQGVLTANGTPVSGDANVRFTLCNNPNIALASSLVAPPITRFFAGLNAGLISTELDFGSVMNTNQALWLSIEVDSPPGSGFVTLSSRQSITPTPQARVAQVAASTPWSGLTGQAGVTTGLIGNGWQMLFNNSSLAVNSSRGGMRLADNGFFEVTTTANATSPSFARLASNGAWTAVSDGRLKTGVTSAEGNLAAALKLRPVNFHWKEGGAEDFGLIAQEVREVLPRLVSGDETKDSLTVNYSQLSVVAIGAIQEQQARIDALARENAELKARLAAIEAALSKLK